MTQLEIKYFFPLTEQLSLDLDYSNCEQPKMWNTITMPLVDGKGLTLMVSNGEIAWSQRIGDWEIPSEKTRPNKLQKFMMKYLIGWKWMGK